MPPTVPIVSHVGSSSLDSHDMPPTVETIEEPHNTDIVENLRRGHRIKFPSTKLQDFVTSAISKICPSNFSTNSSRPLGTPYPLAKYVNYAIFSPKHRHFLVGVSAATEPQAFVEVVKDIQWRNAMQLEIKALENNGTWTVYIFPPNKKAICRKWVFHIKYHSN